MDLKNHCLFCLDKFVTYRATTTDKITFQILCTCLNLNLDYFEELLNVKKKTVNNDSFANFDKSTSCERFMCLECLETVEKIKKLNEELEAIQKKINSSVSRVYEKIVKNNCSGGDNKNEDESLTVKRFKEDILNNGLGKRSRTKRGSSKAINNDCLHFVEAFQNLVRDRWGQTSENPFAVVKVKVEPEDGLYEVIEESNSPDLDLNEDWAMEDADADDFSLQEEVPPKNRKRSKDNEKSTLLDNEETEKPPEISGGGAGAAVFKLEENDNQDWKPQKDKESEKPTEISEDGAEPEPVSKMDEKDNDDEDWQPPSRKKRKVTTTKSKKTKTRALPKKKRKAIRTPQVKTEANLKTCRECGETFTGVTQYYAHRRTHLPVDTDSLGIFSYKKRIGTQIVIVRRCKFCDHETGTKHLSGYMEHMLSHELEQPFPNDPGQLHTCEICQRQFIIKLNLDLHMLCNHSSKHVMLKCEFCGDFSCKTKESFIEHLKTHTDTIFSCKACSWSYSTLDKLLKHMAKHSKSKALFCPECSEVCSTMGELYKHCQTAHSDLKETYSCQFCDKSFVVPSTFQQHQKHAHNYDSVLGTDVAVPLTESDLTCKHCNKGKIYSKKASLEHHIKLFHSDGKDLLKCDQCDRRFIHKCDLQSHIDNKHKGVRFQCPHCIKSYTERTQLNIHMRVHTNQNLNTCPVCGKQFPRSRELTVHMVVHEVATPATRCVCELCGKEYKNEMSLRNHISGTHKEKNLQCEYCQMKFRRHDHLRSHLRTHTGERPYKCEVCQKGFNRRDIMTVHMSVHGINVTSKTKRIHAAKMSKAKVKLE